LTSPLFQDVVRTVAPSEILKKLAAYRRQTGSTWLQ
jgi:hypothetical protein